MRDPTRPIRPMPVRRRGTVLIAAMIIIFALVGMVIVMGQSARVEATASANVVAASEATVIARGAEQYVLGMLAESIEPFKPKPDWIDQLMTTGTTLACEVHREAFASGLRLRLCERRQVCTHAWRRLRHLLAQKLLANK